MLKITSFGGKNWTFRDQPGWKEGTPTQNNHVKVHYKCKQLVFDEKKTSAKIARNHPILTQCASTSWMTLTLFSRTTMVSTWLGWTREIKVCLPVNCVSTCGEHRMKSKIVNAIIIMIAYRTVCMSILQRLIVTYRPVWPAVSAQDYPSIYLMICIHWCHLNNNSKKDPQMR